MVYGEFWWLKEIQVLSLGLGQSNITNLKKGHLLANLNLYPKPLANPNTADPNLGVELVVTIALSIPYISVSKIHFTLPSSKQ